MPTRRISRLGLGALILALAVGFATAPAQTAPPVPPTSNIVTDEQLGCNSLTALRRVLETEDTGEVLTLNVRFLLNGITLERGREVAAVAARSLGAARIDMQTSFEDVQFASTDPEGLIAEARAHYLGAPPQGVDAVYVLSHASGYMGSPKVGMADCVGGMRWPARSFAAGPDWTVEEYRATAKPGMPPPIDPGGIIAAHEIGHLLGGVHELGECLDATSAPKACDIMQNLQPIALVALRFSAPNTSTLRATARLVIDSR